MSSSINRRSILKKLVAGTTALSLAPFSSYASATIFKPDVATNATLSNSAEMKFRHSVCRWCFQDIPLAELAYKAKDYGISAIDLLKPEEWKVVKDTGLECSLATDTFASITNGFNTIENHKHLIKSYDLLIDKAADYGIKQVIVFSGNRNGLSDKKGIDNCALGLDPLINSASKKGVTVVMELLNSKVDHKDYQCDHTEWGILLADKIGSDHFKLLYDIYHMQIMEGNVIATINKYHKYIAHYHTAGVPGRHEIGSDQELYYPAIIKAIASTGFSGYVAQEFIPTYTNKLKALEESIKICTV